MDTKCVRCLSESKMTCGECLSTVYCKRECQKIHWPIHRPLCKVLVQLFREAMRKACSRIVSELRLHATTLQPGTLCVLGVACLSEFIIRQKRVPEIRTESVKRSGGEESWRCWIEIGGAKYDVWEAKQMSSDSITKNTVDIDLLKSDRGKFWLKMTQEQPEHFRICEQILAKVADIKFAEGRPPPAKVQHDIRPSSQREFYLGKINNMPVVSSQVKKTEPDDQIN